MKHFLSNFRSEFGEFMKHFPKRIRNVISYPQYILFLMELGVFILVFLFNIKKIVLDYGIVTTGVIAISWGFLSLINLYLRRNLRCESIKEQIKANKAKEKELETYNSVKGIIFSILLFIATILLVAVFVDSINNNYISELLSVFAIIVFVCKIMVYFYKVSPFLLFPLSLIVTFIITAVGIDKAIINWTLLLLLFGTTIGANFFDKSLVKDRFTNDIKEENLIIRKISFYIGLVFLYIGVYISDKFINSTFYYIHITSEQPSQYKLPMDFNIKCCIFMIVLLTYWGTHKKILYSILRLYYRDKEIKCRSKLAKVVLDEGMWRVIEKNILPQHLTKIKMISIDTCQNEVDNRDTYYVAQESEIPEKIEGLPKLAGYSILGVLNHLTKIFAFLTICMLPAIFILDSMVKVDNGLYYIYGKSDKTDISDTIEISDDTIIYNGKAEKFDTRKQSFSMGKIKKKNSDNITVKFYITGKELQYKKN